jgi:hypothetical protein
MEAKVVYTIEHMDFGENHKDTGWFIMELVIMSRIIINRKPLARFIGDGSLDTQLNMMHFDEYCKAHHRVGHSELRGMEELLRL